MENADTPVTAAPIENPESTADVGPELERLLSLAVRYPELGPPLAALAFKAGWRGFAERVVSAGLAGDGHARGVEYFTLMVQTARREGRFQDVLTVVRDAVREFMGHEIPGANEGARLLQLVRQGFSTLLFDLKDPKADLDFVSALAEAWGGLESKLSEDPLFHVLKAQILWYVDAEAAETVWHHAADMGDVELVYNARGTWAKDAERDAGAAERIYRAGIKIVPNSGLLLHNLAQLLIDRAGPETSATEKHAAETAPVVEAAPVAEAAQGTPAAEGAETPEAAPIEGETPAEAAQVEGETPAEAAPVEGETSAETVAEKPAAEKPAERGGRGGSVRLRLLNEAENLLRRALRGEARGVRRHIHSTLDRLQALRGTDARPDGERRPRRRDRGAMDQDRGPQGGTEQSTHEAPVERERERDRTPKAPVPPPEAGAVVTGRVVSVTTFGAFVALAGGHVGLIHKTELIHGRVDDPSTIIQVGESVEAKVTEIGALPDGRTRIGLSRKALLEAPPQPVSVPRERNDRPSGDRPQRDDRGPRRGPGGGPGGGGPGGGDRGPRPQGDRGPRPEGDRGPRPEGDRGPRPPRRDAPAGEPGAVGAPTSENSAPRPPRNDRGPRPDGDRGPRPPRDDRGGDRRDDRRDDRRPSGGGGGGGNAGGGDRFASEGKVSLGEMLLAKLREQEAARKKG